MRPTTYDLFGEIIITPADIAAWLVAVPRIDPHSPRAAHYIRQWDVVGKIRTAKANDLFEACITPRMIEVQSPAWWDRMCWA